MKREGTIKGYLRYNDLNETDKKLLFPETEWIEKERYLLHKSSQQTKEWFKARRGIPSKSEEVVIPRLTASVFSKALNRSTYFSTEDEVIKSLLYGLEPERTPYIKKIMADGASNESKAREWYEKKTGTKVTEVGLCVPKWNLHLGASVDGVVADGIIEIKCPPVMFLGIVEYEQEVAKGMKMDEMYYKHIIPDYYDQMQGSMAILNVKWCDYIVYSITEDRYFLYRVLFNPVYWKQLHTDLKKFIVKLNAQYYIDK